MVWIEKQISRDKIRSGKNIFPHHTMPVAFQGSKKKYEHWKICGEPNLKKKVKMVGYLARMPKYQ